MDILAEIRQAISIQRCELESLATRVGPSAVTTVEWLDRCAGRVLVTGMGKAGIIAHKIAASLTSIGLPAVFLHPAEALHGDLGLVSSRDVALCLSKSGETEEVTRLVPYFRRFGVSIIAMTGSPGSTLGRGADVVIDVAVHREADSLDVLPTASTTAMLVMGDALTIALLKRREITREQFAVYHPGGTLGRTLLVRVCDVMHKHDAIPTVPVGASVREAIVEITSGGLGAVIIVDAERLCGIFTDGDVRRLLQREEQPLEIEVRQVMTTDPKLIEDDAWAAEAIRRMEAHAVTVLPVVSASGSLTGIIHLHDLIRAGRL